MAQTAVSAEVSIRIVTPWFPVPDHPAFGTFVAEQAALLSRAGHSVEVVHLDSVPSRTAMRRQFLHRPAATRELAESLRSDPGTKHPSGYRTWRIPVPVARSGGWADRCRAMRATYSAFETARPTRPGTLVHAHVLHTAGYAIAGVVPSDAPIVATEHYTGLRDLLEDQTNRSLVAAGVLHAHRTLSVGSGTQALLAEAFPNCADRLGLVPNMVRQPEHPRTAPDPDLRRWITVGLLTSRKRVDLAIEALALDRAAGRDSTLTVVGEGPERAALTDQAHRAGLGAAVTFAGALPADQLMEVLLNHTLMLHLSQFETFGIAPVEGTGAGLATVVTRTDGSLGVYDESLQAAGTELVDIDPSPAQVVAAVENLRRPGRCDPAASHRIVGRKFGPEPMLASLYEHYQHAIAAAAAEPIASREKVLLVGWHRPGARRAAAVANELQDAGYASVIAIRDAGPLTRANRRPPPRAAALVVGGDLSRVNHWELERRAPARIANMLERVRSRLRGYQNRRITATLPALWSPDQVGHPRYIVGLDQRGEELVELRQRRPAAPQPWSKSDLTARLPPANDQVVASTE